LRGDDLMGGGTIPLKRLIQPVLYFLVRRGYYPMGDWYYRLLRRVMVIPMIGGDGEWWNLGPNLTPHDVANFSRYLAKRSEMGK